MQRSVVDFDPMAMNPLELGQCAFWREARLSYFQPLAHHAVEDQRHEANHRVSPYALRQSVIHRGKLDLRFQDSEAALDVGQTPWPQTL